MQGKSVSLYFSNGNHGSLLEIVLKALNSMGLGVRLFLTNGLNQHVFPIERIILKHTISNAQIISRSVFDELNRSDFIILDQLYSFRELYCFSRYSLRKPSLMLVHNCNTWFQPKVPLNPVHLFKYLMTQKVKNKIGHFAVAGENMLEYSKEILGVRNVGLIPFRYDDFDDEIDLLDELYTPGRPIRLVVPGMISERRSYSELLEVIGTVDLKDKVELVLLGRPDGAYGQDIQEQALDLKKSGYSIRFWEDFIPHDEFEREIREADLLFSYFQSEYKTNNGQIEVYGVSKETGIVLLMYNKAKVGILPESFHQMKTIKNQTLTFDNFDHLKSQLLEIYNGEIDLKGLSENAINNAKAMNLQFVIDQISLAFQHQTNRK